MDLRTIIVILALLAGTEILCPEGDRPEEYKQEKAILDKVFAEQSAERKQQIFSEELAKAQDPTRIIKVTVDSLSNLDQKQYTATTEALFKTISKIDDQKKASAITKIFDTLRQKPTMDLSRKMQIMLRGLDAGYDNQNPSVKSAFEKGLTQFRDVLDQIKVNALLNAQFDSSIQDIRDSAKKVVSMLKDPNINPAARVVLIDTAVALMGKTDRSGISLINDPADRAIILSASAELLTKDAINGKPIDEVLKQIGLVDSLVTLYAYNAPFVSEKKGERDALNTIIATINKLNWEEASSKQAIDSLKAKIELIKAFNSVADASTLIPTLPIDTFKEAFSELTLLPNGKTFVDVFLEKILPAEKNSRKFSLMGSEQKMALFKALTDAATVKKLDTHVTVLLQPYGFIEQMLKAAQNDKNTTMGDLNTMIDSLKPLIEHSKDPNDPIKKQAQVYASALIDISTSRADSLVSQKQLDTMDAYIAQTGDKTKKKLEEERKTKVAQTPENVTAATNLLISLLKNKSLTTEQRVNVENSLRALISRIDDPKILEASITTITPEFNSLPESVRLIITERVTSLLSFKNLKKLAQNSDFKLTLINFVNMIAQKIERAPLNSNDAIIAARAYMATNAYFKADGSLEPKYNKLFEAISDTLLTNKALEDPKLKTTAIDWIHYLESLGSSLDIGKRSEDKDIRAFQTLIVQNLLRALPLIDAQGKQVLQDPETVSRLIAESLTFIEKIITFDENAFNNFQTILFLSMNSDKLFTPDALENFENIREKIRGIAQKSNQPTLFFDSLLAKLDIIEAFKNGEKTKKQPFFNKETLQKALEVEGPGKTSFLATLNNLILNHHSLIDTDTASTLLIELINNKKTRNDKTYEKAKEQLALKVVPEQFINASNSVTDYPINELNRLLTAARGEKTGVELPRQYETGDYNDKLLKIVNTLTIRLNPLTKPETIKVTKETLLANLKFGSDNPEFLTPYSLTLAVKIIDQALQQKIIGQEDLSAFIEILGLQAKNLPTEAIKISSQKEIQEMLLPITWLLVKNNQNGLELINTIIKAYQAKDRADLLGFEKMMLNEIMQNLSKNDPKQIFTNYSPDDLIKTINSIKDGADKILAQLTSDKELDDQRNSYYEVLKASIQAKSKEVQPKLQNSGFASTSKETVLG